MEAVTFDGLKGTPQSLTTASPVCLVLSGPEHVGGARTKWGTIVTKQMGQYTVSCPDGREQLGQNFVVT